MRDRGERCDERREYAGCFIAVTVDKARHVLTAGMKEDLIARGFMITLEHLQPGLETPFPGRTSWMKAFRPEPTDLPSYFACGYVAEPSVYYFEDEEIRTDGRE